MKMYLIASTKECSWDRVKEYQGYEFDSIGDCLSYVGLRSTDVLTKDEVDMMSKYELSQNWIVEIEVLQ